MRKIIIGFSKPKGFFKPFSWLIRLFCWTPYSHVYCKHFSQKYDQWLIYQASGTQVNFASGKQFSKDAIVVDEFEFDIPETDFDSYMKWAISESGAHYSIVKLLEIVLKKDIVKSDSPQWVCAVLVAKVCNDYLKENMNHEYADPKTIYEFCIRKGTRYDEYKELEGLV